MKILSVNAHQFEKMPKYQLQRNLESTECELFILEQKDNWNKKLLKKFFVTSGEYFSNKLYTINALADLEALKDIEELVIPEELFALDDEIQGFTMPFIEKNVNLKILLSSDFTSLTKKISALKDIGNILKKIIKHPELQDYFFLGDIHEGNFIYDVERKMYRVVDLDSAKIGDNSPSMAKYLTTNKNLENLPQKYPLNEQEIHISNESTMILSYIYMVLNTIAKINVSKLSINEYYSYLGYLKDQGVSLELVELFSKIYAKGKNKIDIELLDSIPTQNSKILTYESFKR